MKDIAAETKDLDSRIGFKQGQIEYATQVRNYKECDQVAEEIGELKARRRQSNME